MPQKAKQSIDGLSRKPAAKKPVAKKATSKPAAKKTAAKPAAKKPAVKKATTSKAPAKKPVAIKVQDIDATPAAETEAAEAPIVEQDVVESPEESSLISDDITAEIADLEKAEPEMVNDGLSMKKQPKKHSPASKIICLVLMLAELIAGGLLIYALLSFNVLADWQNIAIIAVMVLLFAFTARKLTKIKSKNVTRIICGVLAFILAVSYGMGFFYISTVMGFLHKITMVDNTETQEYSVAVYKDSSIKQLGRLDGKKIGFQRNNIRLKLAEDTLKKSVKYTPEEYDDLANMFIGLDDGTISAITMASSYLEVLKEDAEDYYKQLKVIYTYNIEFEKEEKKTAKVDTQNDPFIVYISGTDSRTGVRTTARSDVNMLAVINPKKNKILLVSVPRDFYVQLHGTTGTKDKLTHAGVYGIDMSKNTMSDLFGGVEIAHTIKVSFGTVENIVNAIDGIDLYSDQSFTAWGDRSCHIPKGYIHLDGKCALAFSRERKAYATGDRHRVKNQQDVLSAILKKATSIQYIVNYPKLLASIEGTFQTSLSYDEITGFAKNQMNTMKSWDVEEFSVNGAGSMQPTYSMGSQLLYVMIPDQNTINEAITKIQETLKD